MIHAEKLNRRKSSINEQKGLVEIFIFLLFLVALIGGYVLFTSQKRASSFEVKKTLAFYALDKTGIVTIIGGQPQWINQVSVDEQLINAINDFTTESGMTGTIIAYDMIGSTRTFIEVARATTDPGTPPTLSSCAQKAAQLASSDQYWTNVANGVALPKMVCIECPNDGCETIINSAKVTNGAPAGSSVPPTPTTAPPTPTPGGGGPDCSSCYGPGMDQCETCICEMNAPCGITTSCVGFCDQQYCTQHQEYCPELPVTY